MDIKATENLTTDGTRRVTLTTTDLAWMGDDSYMMDGGAIVLCRHGTATVRIDFKEWRLHEGSVITLFPNDVVRLTASSDDFEAEMLAYGSGLLREASLQLEQTVYSLLRKDRCQNDAPEVTKIMDAMFGLLRVYFQQDGCTCLESLVLYQLKTFFLGFYDWTRRCPGFDAADSRSGRTDEVFNMFMQLVEQCYAQSHDVAYYAARLSISPKYLTTISKRVTGHTPKAIIDHYVILRLKLLLRSSDKSIKQIAWDHHFSDTPFFCRFFKQHTGMTPQQFRKSLTADNNRSHAR